MEKPIKRIKRIEKGEGNKKEEKDLEKGKLTLNPKFDESRISEQEFKKFSRFNYDFDLSKAKFELDPLQNKMLQFYIRADPRFRRAFYTDYTADFFNFLKEKARLREPAPLTAMGNIRSGKSYSMISICAFKMLCYKKIFNINYICANDVDFLEKLRNLPEEKLQNSTFLIDEEKTSNLGIGSTAKKLKIQDVSNIVAKMNIDTISINPIKWADPYAFYGLRCFGRDFTQKVNRFMLYNLQESGRGGTTPMGNVYLPIFTSFLPKFYAEPLEKDYITKKDAWIMKEVRGDNDALAEIRRNTAMSLLRDKNFKEIEKKGEKLAYINYKLGSDGWTTKEIEDIFQLTKLIEQGYIKE